MPPEVLALGRHLVEELQLEPGVDTLGRWMAHHLAELMTRARKAKDPVQQSAAKEQAGEAILRVWQHRATADRINPLGDLRPILGVLRTLAQEAPPWVYLSGGGRREAAGRTHDLLRRLTICLSVLELGDLEVMRTGLTRARRTAKYQSQEEREVTTHLSLWLDVSRLQGQRNQRASGQRAKDSSPHAQRSDLVAMARQLTEDAQTALTELNEELQSQDV